MVNILFIANAANRARVFIPIADQLAQMGNTVMFLSLDSILDGGASTVIRKSKHPFVELPFTSENSLSDMNKKQRFKTLLDTKPVIAELLENIKPDSIVCGAAAYVEGVAIEQARKRGIKTILMQDGLRIDSQRNFLQKFLDTSAMLFASVVNEWTLAFYGAHYFFTPFGTNRVDGILLFGSAIRDKLLRSRIHEDKLYIVGNPLYDSIAPLSQDRQTEIRNFFGISDNTPVALFAMQCFHKHLGLPLDDEIQIAQNLVDLFRDLPDIKLLIKLHPDNDYQTYMESFIEWNPPENVGLVKDEYTPMELLSISSVFMTVYSTMALESLVHKVPVITLDYTKVKHSLNLEPAGLSVKSKSQLLDFFKRKDWQTTLKNKISEHRDNILDRELANIGFASEKAAEAIVKITLNLSV